MKVGGPGGATSTGAATGARRPAAAAPGFAPSAGSARESSAATPAASIASPGGVEALLAMQELGGPLERRRRAVARGGRLLDELDAVRIALLDGGGSAPALDRLQRAAREAREQAGEPDLDDVLDAIDLRTAVELAKAEMSRHSA